jgi:hypothetical protein
MAKLFSSILDVIAVVGGAVNTSVEIEDISPSLDGALYGPIADVIGINFIEAAILQINPGDRIMVAMKRTNAYLGLWEYSKFSSTQMGGMGLVRIEGENAKSAYKYQENSYRKAMYEAGMNELEVLVKEIEDSIISLKQDGLWDDTVQYACRGHLINYAIEMRQFYNNRMSRSVFETLRPIIADVEQYIIRDIVSNAVMDKLLLYVADSSAYIISRPTEAALLAKVLPMVQKALAHISIVEAVQREWVRVTPSGVVAVESWESGDYDNKRTANVLELNTMARIHERWAIRMIKPIRDYLIEVELMAEDVEGVEAEETVYRCGDRLNCGGLWGGNRVIGL